MISTEGHTIVIHSWNEFISNENHILIECSCGWEEKIKPEPAQTQNKLKTQTIALKHISNVKQGKMF